MDKQLDTTEFVNILASLSKQNPSSYSALVVGEVIDIDPPDGEGLRIRVENGLELTAPFLYLSPWARNMTINIPNNTIIGHSHTVPAHTTSSALSGEYAHTHTISELTTSINLPQITIYYDLVVGDKVHMLQINNSQQFIVLWKG